MAQFLLSNIYHFPSQQRKFISAYTVDRLSVVRNSATDLERFLADPRNDHERYQMYISGLLSGP